MTITSDAATIFRNYATADVPASGPHAPDKAAVRELFADIDSAITAAQADADAASTLAGEADVKADAAQATANESINAIVARGATSGVYWLWGLPTPPVNWIATGGYIGGPTSGASTRANNDCLDLFTVWWVNTTMQMTDNAGSNVSRGASAAADFAAGHRMPVPDLDAGQKPTNPNLKWYVRL